MTRNALVAFAVIVTTVMVIAGEPDAPHDPADEQAIREVVDKYFRGVVNADRALLEQAWHTKQTQMIFVKSLGKPEPTFEAVPIDVALTWWTRVRAESSTGTVLAVDIVEGEMALVKFDFHFEHMHHVEYLTLFKLKEGWKIVNKSQVRVKSKSKQAPTTGADQ